MACRWDIFEEAILNWNSSIHTLRHCNALLLTCLCPNHGVSLHQMKSTWDGIIIGRGTFRSKICFRCQIGFSWLEMTSTCPQSLLHGKRLSPQWNFPHKQLHCREMQLEQSVLPPTPEHVRVQTPPRYLCNSYLIPVGILWGQTLPSKPIFRRVMFAWNLPWNSFGVGGQ